MVTPPPDEYAVSAAIGPLSAIYVHRPARSEEQCPTFPLTCNTARITRRGLA